MNLPMLSADKANHSLYGAAVFGLVGAFVAAAGYPTYARAAGAAMALAIGLLKELVDWLANRRAKAQGLPPPHGVEAADVLATVSGALLCWAAAVGTEA